MSIKIKNRNYYNSKGEKVSKEIFEREWASFSKQIDEEYEEKLDELISQIPSTLSLEDKIKYVFKLLVDNIEYEHNLEFNNDGSVSCPVIKIYNNWGIQVSDKYAPLLLGRSICSGISPLVNDICMKLGIISASLSGYTKELTNGTRVNHIWNVITINGEPKHFDVVYGIYNKESGKNPFEFCLISDDTLRQIGPHCLYDASLFAGDKYTKN